MFSRWQAPSAAPGASSADDWAHLRVALPAIDPAVILTEQSAPDWRPRSGPRVSEFTFAPNADTDQGMLWDLYRSALPRAGIFPNVVYDGTPWAGRVNAYHGGGTNHVPSLKTQIGLSVNWWLKGDGYLRIDGKALTIDAALPTLRKVFPEYVKGQTEHSQYTGRGRNRGNVLQGQRTVDDTARRARDERTRGQVLKCSQASIFSERGDAGIWDVLNERIGARNTPGNMQTPFAVYLRTGVLVTISPAGATMISTATARTSDVEVVERIFLESFGASWLPEEQYAAHARGETSQTVAYGRLRQLALSRLTAGPWQGFL